MASTYDIGDVVRVTGRFSTAAAGTTYQDPTTVFFHYETPGGSVTTGTLTPPSTENDDIHRSSTGEFFYDIPTTGYGVYEYRWFSTGSLTAAEQGWFSVRPNRVST